MTGIAIRIWAAAASAALAAAAAVGSAHAPPPLSGPGLAAQVHAGTGLAAQVHAGTGLAARAHARPGLAADVVPTVAAPPPVSRLWGASRIETSVAISQASFSPGVPVAYIATADNFPDAVSGAPVAGMNGGPVLLTPPAVLPSVVAGELARLEPGRIVVLGGSGVVSDAVLRALKAYTAGTVTRLWGASRIETSVAISAASFSPGVPVAYVATAGNFPDALSGGPVAAMNRGPVLLTPTSALPSVVAAELARLEPERIVVLGEPDVVSSAVFQALKAYTTGTVTRLAGPSRIETSVEISKASFSPGVPVVYLATSRDFPDALSAAPVAGMVGAPLLLTEPGALPDLVGNELARLDPDRIVILGGTGVVSIAVQTRASIYVRGSVSGTVTEAGGAGHGLAGVNVVAGSLSTDSYGTAVTDADGHYTVDALFAVPDTQVCFDTSDATGGSADAYGYLSECYDGAPPLENVSGDDFVVPGATLVEVRPAAATTGIDASVIAGAALSGTVTDAGGTHQPLAGVSVGAYSWASGRGGSTVTGADGTYVITRLPAASDIVVTFIGRGATGGSSDDLGYAFTCYQGPACAKIPVASGVMTSGIDAALEPAGAISGTVRSEAPGHPGIADVTVIVEGASYWAVGTASTAADGTYFIDNLPAGSDYVVTFLPPHWFKPELYANVSPGGTPTYVSVAPYVITTGIDADLTPQ